jgi:hypothetical protein
MGFGKSFLFCILAFVGLNFVFTIIYYALIPMGFETLFTSIQSNPIMILYYLFGSIISTPFIIFNWTIAQPILIGDMSDLILGLGYLVSPIIAAILAGRFGENKGQSFSGWLLTAVISIALIIIGSYLSPALQDILGTTYEWGTPTPFNIVLVYSLISCMINIVFYGFFALLLSKTEYY